MRVLTEFLEIADDARMEGRTCAVYHNGIVEAAGTLRRISNRLASLATARVLVQMPQLDSVTEFARERVFNTIRGQLKSWLDFFNSAEWSSAVAARAIAEKHSPDFETLWKTVERRDLLILALLLHDVGKGM